MLARCYTSLWVTSTRKDAGICCDATADVEWKVKSIVSITVDHSLPFSVFIPD